MVFIEISPSCSFRCPSCNMEERLHIDKSRDDPKLVEKIIKNVPKDSYFDFVGLGEPLMPLGQKRIIEIMEKRSDAKGFIQTNGSFKIHNKIVSFIQENRLEIGMSYDEHHKKGMRREINIQKDLVSGLSMSLSSIPQNFAIKELKEEFPNLNRILVEPLINKVWYKPFISWDKILNFCKKIAKNNEGIIVYMELSKHWKGYGIDKIMKEAMKQDEVIKDWYLMPEGFYIYLDDYSKSPRILINSTVLPNGSKAELSWDKIEDELIPIEKFYKSE